MLFSLTPNEVRINANHLKRVDDETLQTCIDEAYTLFIADFERRYTNRPAMIDKLKIVAKYLAQHIATLNVRRADSESIGGMSKSISVPKDKDLEQTEYGQMAKKIAKNIPLPWATDDLPAGVVIY